METEEHCPNCGNRLAANALGGLCPACLMNVSVSVHAHPSTDSSATQTATHSPQSPPPIPLAAGTEFGRYRIVRWIGHGGMGVVYEAEEIDSGRRVALKVIHQKLSSSHDRRRFLREGRLAASINHPNCVYVFGTEEIDGIPVIAMEFVPGGTLEERLHSKENLPIANTVDAVLEVIAGLEAAQAKGILHRDIKPSNCFEDEEGQIKIGDFGLSMSTEPRTESLITETGTMLGTPSYCPPEQLRGEELDTRTDMYAVGVMLYQLLTGRLPFEGKSMPQLIANTLEKRAPSPRHARPEIPRGLAKIILRCLEKQPAHRFRSYSDLRRALAPYSSTAPTPATLGLRFLAGLLDQLILNILMQGAIYLFFGNPLTVLDRMVRMEAGLWRMVLPSFATIVFYYTLAEWRWGASLGKAICRLRLIRLDGGNVRLSQAALRAACYVMLPTLPFWIVTAISGTSDLYSPSLWNSFMGGTQFLIGALLFVTARRRNGYSAVYDLLTGTRIVGRMTEEMREGLPLAEVPQTVNESAPRIGPYHKLNSLGKTGDADWEEGYDLRLLRRVLIRSVPPGTPIWPEKLCYIARVGRLRWLAGRRGPHENWDAFEGVGGAALLQLAHAPQPWAQVRFWLYDLATELAATRKDDTLPEQLTLDRVWITQQGRAKLLDVPAPGCEASRDGDPALSPSEGSTSHELDFLNTVAAFALGGSASNTHPEVPIATPLPLHARTFLGDLPSMADPETASRTISPLLRRVAHVTRLRRAMIAAVCILIPLVLSLGLFAASYMNRKMESENPELMRLADLLQTWKLTQLSWLPQKEMPSEKDFGVYIAAHYADIINDQTTWTSAPARLRIGSKARAFAETCLVQYAGATPDEQAQAETTLAPLLKNRAQSLMLPTHEFIIYGTFAIVVAYVALPAVFTALLFRGGVVLRACGVTFVRRDGRPASRLRFLWRALVAWVPVIASMLIIIVWDGDRNSVWPLFAGVYIGILAIVSLLLPIRGIPDRLAGTWPVPR